MPFDDEVNVRQGAWPLKGRLMRPRACSNGSERPVLRSGSRGGKIFFIRPPRYRWPLMSEAGGFWPPLGLAALAAAVREAFPAIHIRIVDCPGLRMGWRSLARLLSAERPDIVGLGDEAVCAHESLRCARLVKATNPDALVIGGGYFFSYMAGEVLPHQPIDVVVRGEGERALVRLLAAHLDGGDPASVRGVAFQEDGRVRATPSAPLIEDLDRLPFPAWDLLPTRDYGRRARSHQAMATLEHSRGCVDSCSFCILWRHMGRPVHGNGEVRPCYRTKSPERSFDEVRHLVERYDRRTLCWVDPTWNADAAWTDRFCDLLLRSGLRVRFSAWMRADRIVRDERLGLLEKQVRAGLVRAMIGIERPGDGCYRDLGKHHNGYETCWRAFEILRTKYPQVLTIGTLIFGLWDETPRSLARLADAGAIADLPVYLPLTPHPGTQEWRRARAAGILEVDDPSNFDLVRPVLRTRRCSASGLRRFHARTVLWPSRSRLTAWWRFLRSGRIWRGRGPVFRLGWRAVRVALRSLWLLVDRGEKVGRSEMGIRPRWYSA